MNKIKFQLLSVFVIASLLLAGFSANAVARPQQAATDPGLGAAANASILATTGVTNTGISTTNRDVDVSPGPSCIPPVGLSVGGVQHFCDGEAASALAAATAASISIPGQPLTSNQGPALDGLTLVSGVYDIGAGQLNGGILTLDGPGIYIFRASSSLVSSGSIVFKNGARACDLYWRVETLATINGSSFAGTIIAGTGVHFGDSVTLDGRALAINGDVTLLNNTITGPSCAAPAVQEEEVDATAIPTVSALPASGGSPLQSNGLPIGLAVFFGGLSVFATVLIIRAMRRNYRL